jgi:hypothetical protein
MAAAALGSTAQHSHCGVIEKMAAKTQEVSSRQALQDAARQIRRRIKKES